MLRILFVLIIGVPAGLAAPLTVPFEQVPAHAIRHNRDLAAARLRIEEARGRLEQSGRLSNPEIEVDFARGLEMPEGELGVALTQRFPVTSRLRLEKAVSRAELSAAIAEVADAERKIAAEAGMAAVRLLANRLQRDLRNKQLANSREQAEFARKRVASGEASTVDATQFDLEVQQLQTELLQLDVEAETLQGELRPLLGAPATREIVIGGTLPPPTRTPSGSPALSERPDYRAAQATAEAARQGSTLAKARKWEDFSFGVGVSSERSMDMPAGYERDYMIGFRFSIPLPLWDNSSGRIREAAATAARAEKEVDALELKISAEVAAARREMAALAKVINELDATVLPKAADLEDRLRQFYTSGQSPLTEVLRARDRRLQLQSRRVDALRDYHVARMKFRAATGQIGKSRK
jgi:cobalt-zinc-cadmium efflux system outer membrane protein